MAQFTAELIQKRLLEKWEAESETLRDARSLLKKCGDNIEVICRGWLLHELNRELKQGFIEYEKEENPKKEIKNLFKKFAVYEWGGKANKIFLDETERFEIIQGKIMRVSSKEIAMELYFRIKSEEQTFDMASYVYGEGQERKNGGDIRCSVRDFPYGLGKYMKSASDGDMLKPIRVKKFFVLVQLIRKENAEYNERVEVDICMSEFGKWVESLVREMVTMLQLGESVGQP